MSYFCKHSGGHTENAQQQHRLWSLKEESYLDPHVKQNFDTQVSEKVHTNNFTITDLGKCHREEQLNDQNTKEMKKKTK